MINELLAALNKPKRPYKKNRKNRYPLITKDNFEQFIMPIPESGCWIWMGLKNKGSKTGYGYVTFNEEMMGAHRIAWILYKGEIQNDMHVLHKCDVIGCVNPDHLYLGTHQDNFNDIVKRKRHPYAGRDVCKHGHPRTEENTLIIKSGKYTSRLCKICRKLTKRH